MLENKWVSYTQRGYFQIKQSIVNRVRSSVPEQTDLSESNIFVILISIFSGLVEQINYYIDQLLRESFVTTARRYSSLVKHSRLFDYRIKAASPAFVDVLITLKKEGETYTLQEGESETIPLGTEFESDKNLKWYSLKNINIQRGRSTVVVPLAQYINVTESYTIPNSDPDQQILIGTRYVHNSMNIIIDGQSWEQVSSFGRSLPNDLHYIVDIGIEGIAYVQFGDDTRGAIPNIGSPVQLSYRNTSGERGNIQPGSINEAPPITLTSEADELIVNNPQSASGGTGYENIDSLRKNIPHSLRVLDRAVTQQDYSDIAALHPAVKSAYAHYECGKYVDIYVAPATSDGGVASIGLLDDVKEYFQKYKMITTFINVLPAGISRINLTLNITGNLMVKAETIKNEVIEILLDNYDYNSSWVNRPIRKSQIYSLVHNRSSVKHLIIDNLSLTPYAFPINHLNPLDYKINILGLINPEKYRLTYINPTSIALVKGGSLIQTLSLGNEVNIEGKFTIKVNSGTYVNGDSWEFMVIPKNEDLVTLDNSIPMLLFEDVTLNITETFNI